MAKRLTPEERAALAPCVTNLEGPVFALTNLPEVVKGALFARYSRSPKSLRRLFLDEFRERASCGEGGADPEGGAGESGGAAGFGERRADDLYDRVFIEYGDDSVAQLGGVHLACEGVSNVLTKVLERGRLMAYLEQSTRYVPYTGKPGGRWKYVIPPELREHALRPLYEETLDHAFETYKRLLASMQGWFAERFPRAEDEPPDAHARAIRAKALDATRGLLPAATRSNVGIYGTGQAYEALLLRMRASPLAEVRRCAARMLTELRKVIPAFMKRVDLPDRGGVWSDYLAATRRDTAAVAERLLGAVDPEESEEVTLTDFDRDGETKVVAAALYAVTELPDRQLLEVARGLSDADRAAVLRACVGDRRNRRHKPGRAFERTFYRFDVLSDYGGFRDLQRHRMLTIEWQRLSTDLGYLVPREIDEAGFGADFRAVTDRARALHDAVRDAGLPEVAPYAVSMAYRIRYVMEMNAREAMHVIELRTTPAGHPAYRRVCQRMHRLIAEEAGHRAIAAAISFADHSSGVAGRREAEKRTSEKRRRAEYPHKGVVDEITKLAEGGAE